MKLHKLALLPLAACAVFGTAAQADSGEITFKGRVVSTGCTPKLDGKGKDGTVTLPDVTEGMFGADNTAGEKTFAINLEGCSVKGKKVKAFFWNATLATGNGRLDGTGSGDGWTYQLRDSANNILTVANSGATVPASNDDVGATIDASGNAVLNYSVRYYKEQALTSGDKTAKATYVVYLD